MSENIHFGVRDRESIEPEVSRTLESHSLSLSFPSPASPGRSPSVV